MQDQFIRRNRLLLPSVFLVLAVTLIPGDGKVLGMYLDKVVHFVIFFILGINSCFKYQQSDKLIGVLFRCIILGLLTEVLQQFVPGRTMDIYDGIADTLGVICAYYVYQQYQSKLDSLLVKIGA